MIQDATPVLDAMEISRNSVQSDLLDESLTEEAMQKLLQECIDFQGCPTLDDPNPEPMHPKPEPPIIRFSSASQE